MGGARVSLVVAAAASSFSPFRDHPHLRFTLGTNMSRALRRDAGRVYPSSNRTVGTGRTSPPVRRRDPFSACRSTRGVRRWKAISTLSSLAGVRVAFRRARDRTALFCRGRRNRNAIRSHVAIRSTVGLLWRGVGLPAPYRPTVSGGCQGLRLVGAAAPIAHRGVYSSPASRGGR